MRHKLGIDGRMIYSELVTPLGSSAPCIKTACRKLERLKQSCFIYRMLIMIVNAHKLKYSFSELAPIMCGL